MKQNIISNNKSIRIFGKTMKCIWNYKKSYVIFGCIISIIIGFLPTISLVTMQNILNLIQMEKNVFGQILKLVYVYIGIEISLGIITAVKSYIDNKILLSFNKYINVIILEKAASLSLEEYEDSETYNTIVRAQGQTNSSIVTSFTTVMSMFQYIITCISQIIVLLAFRMWIVCVITILPIIKYIFAVYFNKEQYKLVKSRTTKERKIWYISYLITTGNAFKEIKLFNLKDFLLNKYEKISDVVITEQLNLNKKIYLINIILDFLDQIITGGIFIYIIYMGYIQSILVGNVISYTRCMFNIKTSLTYIMNSMNSLVKEIYLLDMLFEFLDRPENNNDMQVIKLKSIDTIEVKSLSYKPKDSDKYILKNISLKLEKNKKIVLLGLNGAGKTTLSKILMGFYDRYEGEIYINGVDFRKIDKGWYMSKIAAVFQDFIKYEATVRENVGYGNLLQLDNKEEIIKALNIAEVEKSLYEGKRGIDNELGYWFDGGHQISLGEWQRLAISRAFIKKSDFYILDEPNASLDIITEANIMKKYSIMCKNKIGIFISHRINSFYLQADEIIILDKGIIVERGTHKELMDLQGKYTTIYNMSNEKG